MKHLICLIITGFIMSSIIPQISYSQSSALSSKTRSKVKTSSYHKKAPKRISKEEALKKINNNTKSFKKNLRGTWLLEEDFESGIFPPVDWSLTGGDTEWEQYYGVSGYGNGIISMFYSSWNCNYSDNTIYTSVFNQTQFGDKLIFDFAYAPYEDMYGAYYDALEIYYYDDMQEEWYSLVYYDGYDLQTAPGTENYFEPQSNEWGTMIVDIPEYTTQIYFQVWENCSNNLFLDNIRIGDPSGNSDASVEFVWAKGKLPLGYGVPDKIPALIKNNGFTGISNLMVYLNISGSSNLLDSIEIPYIGPGDTTQVDFLGFTPVLNGFSNVTVSIPDDDNNSNNSKTFLSEANPNTIRYVDSNCCNSGVGWSGENGFLNKYYMTGTGQIRNVNIKIGGSGNAGQIVYAYVVNSSGLVVGKSRHYKIKSTDETKYTPFEITDPKPVVITNDFYFVGLAQTEFAGDGTFYGPQQFLYEVPARPDANYWSYLVPVGSNVGVYEFGRSYGLNYAIESVIGNQATTDAGISSQDLQYEQYFNSSTVTLKNKVFNAGTGSMSFSVRRTINPGGYTSTKSVSGLAPGGNANVTFDPWTFTSGTTYTMRDSILISDGNNANNQMNTTITPRVAKQMCVLWSQQKDRDSLVRAINNDGRYANNFDTVRINYTGSYQPWKIMFVNFKEDINYSPWVRDSLKSFVDNSTVGNKKSLVVFSDRIAISSDPVTGYPTPSDTVFYRQYLRAKTISDDWVANIPDSESKFRGIGSFSGITQDSVSDPWSPSLIKPVNGSSAAFKPMSVTGNGADSCIAVSFAGALYNTFFMTNQFSSLRATSGSPSNPLGPVIVYTKIIDWLLSASSSAKVLELTATIEGFYNISSNLMVRDTMRVFLRNSALPFAIVDSAKVYLTQSGQGSFVFNNASNGTPYYIQLKHRNGLETWSKTTQAFVSNSLTYNFTTDSAKAFGNNMKKQGSSWVVFAGDVNQDGFTDLSDVVIINNAASVFTTGYVTTDVNGDSFSDLSDLILANNNNSAFVQKVIPSSGPEILSKYGVDHRLLKSNEKINVSQQEGIEIIPDNEIYEIFRNKFSGGQENSIPDLIIIENNKTQRIIRK